MDQFECDVPTGDGVCSDNECPCSDTPIPRGTGYLFISEDLVSFRRQYPALESARAAVRQRFAALAKDSRIVYQLGPMLMCEQGARLRGIDLSVAAEDARAWWDTGRVPLRATPTATMQSEPDPVEVAASSAARVCNSLLLAPSMTPGISHSTKARIVVLSIASTAKARVASLAQPEVMRFLRVFRNKLIQEGVAGEEAESMTTTLADEMGIYDFSLSGAKPDSRQVSRPWWKFWA